MLRFCLSTLACSLSFSVHQYVGPWRTFFVRTVCCMFGLVVFVRIGLFLTLHQWSGLLSLAMPFFWLWSLEQRSRQ
eukprot:m.258253 g.258253  ORF g.258253 m.258253 type:complete len:76 (+) comp54577_c1_seq7:2395-2622(+)